MGRKWVAIVSLCVGVVATYVFFQKKEERSGANSSVVSKQPHHIVKMKSRDRIVASAQQKRVHEQQSSQGGSDDFVAEDPSLDPRANPFLAERMKRNKMETTMLSRVRDEKRENLDLQLMGTDSWSVFSELHVSKDPVHNPLFAFGPFHVGRKDNQGAQQGMSLIYNENQQVLGVLTGRVVVKVRDVYDMDPVVKEHDLKVDNVSAKIRTAYLSATHVGALSPLNKALKNDHRVERFYFEVVRADLVRN